MARSRPRPRSAGCSRYRGTRQPAALSIPAGPTSPAGSGLPGRLPSWTRQQQAIAGPEAGDWPSRLLASSAPESRPATTMNSPLSLQSVTVDRPGTRSVPPGRLDHGQRVQQRRPRSWCPARRAAPGVGDELARREPLLARCTPDRRDGSADRELEGRRRPAAGVRAPPVSSTTVAWLCHGCPRGGPSARRGAPWTASAPGAGRRRPGTPGGASSSPRAARAGPAVPVAHPSSPARHARAAGPPSGVTTSVSRAGTTGRARPARTGRRAGHQRPDR